MVWYSMVWYGMQVPQHIKNFPKYKEKIFLMMSALLQQTITKNGQILGKFQKSI